MLVIALVLVILFYVGIYLFWEAAQPHLGPAVSTLTSLNHAIFMPEGTIFLILRGLILATLFYVVADAAYSFARRQVKRKHRDDEDATRAKSLPARRNGVR